MRYYKYLDKTILVDDKYTVPSALQEIPEETAKKCSRLFIGFSNNREVEAKSIFLAKVDIDPADEKLPDYLKGTSIASNYPNWVKDMINDENVSFLNLDDRDLGAIDVGSIVSCIKSGDKARVNILGLGDVGGILLIGLRLLGHDCIESVGIFDLDENKLSRWEAELNQIVDPMVADSPDIRILSYDEIFDCDMFAFCASRGVPPVGSDVGDVRLYQLEANSKLIDIYAKEARKKQFKGIFAVVSDPVDQLCKVAYDSSNANEDGKIDGLGLKPEQVRGYGLGVMYARSQYYLKRQGDLKNDLRAYGPHGKDLVIANSISEYDNNLSIDITAKTVTANMDIRSFGYKPYIAPALSSGAIALINTLKGNWHYSAVYLDGCYFGVRNRLTENGTDIEKVVVDDELYSRIENSYRKLKI